MNWHNPAYLQQGNARQRRAYAVLQALSIWVALREFDPLLAGTVPLGIDTPASDLDLICEVPPPRQLAFRELLRARYGQQPGFQLRQLGLGGQEAIIANFRSQEEDIEVFGQALPTRQQRAYRHLVVEHRVLLAGGEPWRQAVRHLKEQGIKTEPAFAALLGLAGDPYEALLTLESLSPAELAAWLRQMPPAGNELLSNP